ncbi:3-isopropylmalate/(R)-2-methylmalate dehydratase small subunit [Rhizobium sp. NFR07]|uniref:3-isopropylmalate dehydratase small subunit n=1 Tax=Rhizobium sp. NFR07 TaxID=1566262 RepID=UPI0008F33607|nr:3-isopropylmalate dehydratase small subunit [Rhizobium sp. NFR07]SFB16132.1 3-isopropylmalate/(R)-2-methylmalate dehydratase small subunit [Rhizobium sp. NFR07]
MKPFISLEAKAAPLPFASVDTDQLIPARFMKRSRSEGYGQYLLYDMRFDGEGRAIADLPLNAENRQGAEILVARRNFGAGSSREAAVYALVDYGFRCVIAPSFGDIFSSNSVNNGLLPARVTEEDAEEILALLEGGHETIAVDLETQEIRLANHVFRFEVEPVWRTKLLNGWDDLDLTASYAADISRYVEADKERHPWLQQTGAD